MERFEYQVLSFINHLAPHHWIMILAAVVIVGSIFMKSAGNKSHF